MASTNSNPNPEHLGPMGDVVNSIYPQTLVFDCGKCMELKVVPWGQFGCPDCGEPFDDDPITCGHSDPIKRQDCQALATHLEEWMEAGPTSRILSQPCCEPRCGKH
jgi:hypothetical protein